MTTTVVVGAHGVIGGATLRHLNDHDTPTWSVARRGPVTDADGHPIGRHLQVDLLDSTATTEAFAQLTGEVDLVFAGYLERPTMRETVGPNVAMLAHTLAALHASPAQLRAVVLIGGGKSYGEHLGAYKTPAKESDPRFLGPIFYNDQEDLLFADAAQHGYTWTVLRPDAVIGHSVGSPMNMLNGVAAYGALCAAQEVPMRFPGSGAAWTALHQATDAELVAEATAWALTEPRAANEIFNITNGDNFRWCHLWDDLADFFGIRTAAPQPMNLGEQMADKAPLWDEMISRHQLRAPTLEHFVSWPFVDGWFGMDFDMVQSTIKIRQAGFAGCIDTHTSFLNHLGKLRTQRLIP